MEEQLRIFDVDLFANPDKLQQSNITPIKSDISSNPLLNFIDRLDAIEITTDNRISTDELEYCKKVEAVYLETKNAQQEMLIKMNTLFDLHKNQRIEGEAICYVSIHDDINHMEDRIKSTYSKFVNHISSYFSKRHNVTLLPKDIIDKYSCDNISYKIIVDEIFEQLGGLNFREKAEEEIKTKSREIVYRKNENISITKNKLTLSDIIHWNPYCFDGRKELDWSEKKIHSLFIGLSHFIDKRESMHETLSIIYGQLQKGNIKYDIFSKYEVNVGCLTSFKIFKNGKIELVFSDNTHAEEFKNEYLL